MAESPTIKVLVGLTVPEFEIEMQGMVQALGVNCNYCHVARDFANEQNARKQVARKHLEMTLLINKQFFANPFPPPESKLGTVTCMTCHQGSAKPKVPAAQDLFTDDRAMPRARRASTHKAN